MLFDSGLGIILPDSTEPLCGTQYLRRKFKIGFTVPGDTSLNIYAKNIDVVVIMEEEGKTLKGFNVMVGGAWAGRTTRRTPLRAPRTTSWDSCPRRTSASSSRLSSRANGTSSIS